ncbi:hypothetical protein L7F22_031236 [Adiantum nelumboides]|nr:hypothetical protein [Adiantum nelumboides]
MLGTVFGGMQGMVPNPVYANIGMQPGFQGTQGEFGVSQGNLGMAGFSILPVNMTPGHQHVTGQGVQMAPTGEPIMQIVSYDNLEQRHRETRFSSSETRNAQNVSVSGETPLGETSPNVTFFFNRTFGLTFLRVAKGSETAVGSRLSKIH